MSEGTSIEWTSTTGLDGRLHAGMTFSPWWGCERVSPGCDNCYAEAFDHRLGGAHWGPHTPYKLQSDKYWLEPLKWDRKALKLGVRLKVFCASMADVFDVHAPAHLRVRLWKLIRSTPNLDWLLLTKRPQNFERYLPWMPCPNMTDVCKYSALSGVMCPQPDESSDRCDIADGVGREDDGALPAGDPYRRHLTSSLSITNTREPWPNCWLGVTAENQKEADRRIPILLRTPAAIRFVSYEPALELVDFSNWISPRLLPHDGTGYATAAIFGPEFVRRVDWIICGSESGRGARPFDEAWARSARDQCATAGVPFFLKQKLVDGIKIGRPKLDGRQHVEQPR